MSIVIPVGVDTADTSYLDMAAGSEWVKTTTSLITLPFTCSSHFHKGLHYWLKKVHPHSILLLLFTRLWFYSEACHPEIIWFPVPCFSMHASTCQTEKPILWLYSIPSFHHFFPRMFTRLLLMRKEFVAHESRAPTEPAWMVSSVLMLTLTAQLITDHILIFSVYCLLVW